MKYLIDTDWVVEYLKGRPPAVETLAALRQEGLAISLITYGEIYEGIYTGREAARHEEMFLRFLRRVRVLPLNREMLKQFARIRGQLRAQGQLIGDLDLLIAATALYHDLTVVTHNTRHFSRVPDLQLYQGSSSPTNSGN
jgi:predicted nucleic acid-binding protein